MRRIGIAFGLAAALTATATARAQVATVMIKSAGGLIDDARFLAKAILPEEQAVQAVSTIDQFTGREAAKGLDRTRPLGAFADLPAGPGQLPSVVVFLPTDDFAALLATLGQFGLQAEERGEGGFTHQINLPTGMPLYALNAGGYAFFSLAPAGADRLKALRPADLASANGPDIRVSVRIDRVPEEQKKQFLAQLDQNLARERERKPDENDASFRGRMAGMDLTKDAIARVVRDGRELAVDYDIDAKRGEVAVEYRLTAKSGSPMAATIGRFGERRSRFAGLGRDGAMGAWMSLPIDEALRDVMRRAFDQGRREAEAKAKNAEDRQLAARVLDALQPTFTAGELDMGAGILGPVGTKSRFVGLVALRVRDGRKLDAALRELAKKARDQGDAKVTLDAEKAADGTPIHRFQFDAPDDPKAKQLFGQPVGYAAIRDDVAVLAVGEEGLDALRRQLAAPARATAGASAPVEMVVSASKVAQLNTDADRDAILAASREVFGGQPGDADRVSLRLTGDRDALRLRAVVGVPVLRFFALAGTRANAGREK